MKLLVIIPTYNEIDNITAIIPQVFQNIPQDAGILVVDDGSPDGTADAVKNLRGEVWENRLHLLERTEKKGLADAYITGFKWGIEHGYDVLCEMDADFSHKPEYLPKLYEAIQTHDVAIGSRNIKGGSVEGWSVLRNCISKGGSLYSRLVLGVNVKDLTGGFNMWRKDTLDKIGLDTIISKG
nr:polyprenol monophosphomannose synthase [Treponema sp.]